jgi:outer membrane lipoprotein carrier protein
MIRIYFLLLAIGSVFTVMAQDPNQDPAAKEVLDRVATRARQMKSIQADFELLVEDKKENTKNKSTGNLILKQDKYKITTTGSVVYFNGKTMWTYTAGNHEVTITEPEKNDEDFMNNPANIFSFYNRDFKYRYIQETTRNGLKYHEIDLFPKDLHQPYFRIKVYVNEKNDMPEIISSFGKDGVDYTVNLTNFQLDRDISDSFFTFDTTKDRKVEVIDMRGVK